MLSGLRARVLLVFGLWLATLAAVTTWWMGTQTPTLRLAAGEAGSESHQLATTIAQALNESDADIVIRVYDTGGSVESLALVESGKVDLAVVQADVVRPENVLDVARLFPGAYHLLVNASLDIQNFADLRNLRVAIPPADSAQNQGFWALAEHYGLEPKDISAQAMGPAAASFALAVGQVDAIFSVRAPGNAEIRRLMATGDLALVPIEQAAALALSQPALSRGLIPRGSYGGEPARPDADLPVPVLNRILVASGDLPDQLIFRFTRRLFELQADIMEQLPLAGFIGQRTTESDVDSRTHPGARQFYDREKPGMLQQNARLASALLYTAVIAISAVVALRGRWLKARRLRMADFNKRLMKIAASARDATDRAKLLAGKNALMDILAEVVHDLDADKVTQEEFDHFSFTWQAVDAVVRDQLLLLQVDGNTRGAM